jgi:hypothetical protein
MAKIAITTNPVQQTTEQTLLAVDPTIVFGTFADTVFGTATARTIDVRLDRFSLNGYTVWHGTGQLPNFSNYRWSDAYDTSVPTRVVFQLDTVKAVAQ